MCELHARTVSAVSRDVVHPNSKPVEFFSNLSTTAMSEFESLAVRQFYPARTVLLREGENPSSVMRLHEGRVKVSLNSSEGRRLILGFSGPGEFLGLNPPFPASPTR